MNLRTKCVARVAMLALMGGALSCGAPTTDGQGDIEEAVDTAQSAVVAVEQQKLLHANPHLGDNFGNAVAISGDTAVVGAHADDTVENSCCYNNQGTVWVYTKVNGAWVAQQQLQASDGLTDDFFGSAVALDGDTLAVGAPGEDQGYFTEVGAVYVFTRTNGVWSQQAKIEASDGFWFDNFGRSVGLSGNTLIVGAEEADTPQGSRGAAYIFTRTGATWTQSQKLLSADGDYSDYFGSSVAIDGDRAIIGARSDDSPLEAAGSAYVFTRSGGTFTQQQKLTASDAQLYAFFGNRVAIDGDTALVAAHRDAGNKGAAYVFTFSGTTWSEQAKLTASDGVANDYFGNSLALLGDVALVGMSSDDIGSASDRGSAYLFERDGETWAEQQKLTASDGAASDLFGTSVALGPDVAIVGALWDVVSLNGTQGSAYVFDVVDPTQGGTACTEDTECASGFCVDGYCCDSACGGDDPSDCQACSLATGASANGTCTPLPSGIVCRAQGGVCDVAEACDGVNGACPADAKVPSTTVCRTSSGGCDVPEWCTGTGNDCPVDGAAPAGTPCGSVSGECDVADTCDGSSKYCNNLYAPAGTVCRASAGVCDPQETCSGTSSYCPSDSKSPAGTVCRASSGACDPVETCNGSASSCPADVNDSCGNPVCITLQRGVNGTVADSYLSVINGGWAPGTQSTMTTGGTGVGRGLVRFDLSPIPSGATVTSATVTLYAGWNTSFTNVRAHKVLNPWAEATVSYNNFWASSNFAADVIASFAAGNQGFKSFDITALAAQWVSGATANHGLLLEEDIGVAPPLGRHQFTCSEGGTVSQRPKLQICYLP
jgi:hypothetical protein